MWLKKLSWYKSIGTKISILTSLLAILLTSVYTYFAIQNQRKQLIDEVIRGVNLLSDTIKLSTRQDMLLYAPDRLHHVVDTIGSQPSLEKIRIFNYMGEIIYSSDKSEMNLLVDKRAEQCYMCHAAEQPLERLTTPERTRIFTNSGGERVLGIINPIYNEPDCYTANCHVHPPEQKVLGVLDIDISLSSVDEHIVKAEWRLVLIGLATLVSLSFLITFLISRFLKRPVRDLIEGAHRVAQGDLEVQIPIRSNDELGVFANSFNSMTKDLKKANESITEWGNRLEQLVDERTRELSEAQEQIVRSAKLASLGKLAAGVAHEINNPLTGVLTFSQLLMEQFPPESPEHQDLQVIHRETLRCRKIVRGLLDFSRQTAPEKRLVEADVLLDEVLGILGNQESFLNIQLIRELEGDIPALLVDRDQLKQVFLNILVNAAEAMAKTGGTLKIRTEWHPDRSRVAISFQDTGTGIDPEHLDKLFDPFYTTKEMGTGLGLAVSYGIIKAHRGNIEVKSKPGGGCRVTVYLPADPVQIGASINALQIPSP